MHVCSFTSTISLVHGHAPKTVLHAQNLVQENLVQESDNLLLLKLKKTPTKLHNSNKVTVAKENSIQFSQI